MNRAQEHERFAAETCAELVAIASNLRAASYLSQKQVSEHLGLQSHGNITLIEQGKSIPRLDKFLKLLSVYGYTLKIVPKEEKKSGAP